jgi:hypothetical protein
MGQMKKIKIELGTKADNHFKILNYFSTAIKSKNIKCQTILANPK